MSDQIQEIKTALAEIETNLGNKLETRLNEIKAGLNVPDQDAKIKALETEHAQLKADLQALEAKANRLDFSGGGRNGETKSSGALFVESEEFKSRPGTGSRFSITVEQKALTNAAGSAGVLTNVPQRLPMQEPPREPHIRDLIPGGTTTSRILTFPQRKSWTNNAAMVAEGGLKPESDFSFEMVTTEVKKIAHYVKASTELLDDADALHSYIDAQLVDGLDDVEDRQIIKGDGTGQNLLGLYTVAQAFTRGKAGDTLLDTLLRAQTQLRLVNRTASGYVLNPEDWEDIMLLKGTDNRYVWANIPDGNGKRLWAVPVRDTTALAKGEWLAGDFRRAAQLFDRQQSTITVANQNQDDFIHNLVTILAERREALVVFDRLALVKNAAG